MTTRIIGTGRAVPARTVSNHDLAHIVDTSDQWIRTRTGIRNRRIVTEEEGTTSLAVRAARAALLNAGVKAEELDIIVLATSSPEENFPSGACRVQAAIGAGKAVAFDLGQTACSGFIFALNTVHSFIKAGIYRTGLVIGADTLSRLLDWTDRGTCVLFGDGAGAAVVRADETGIFHMTMASDGTGGDVLECKTRTAGNFLTEREPELRYITMNGQAVFKFAVKTVPEMVRQALAESGTDIEEIKYFILHQANSRIFEAIAKRLEVSADRFPMNLEEYGNTSAASVPILLDELNRAGRLKTGDKLLLSGFGAGLTWGTTLLEW